MSNKNIKNLETLEKKIGKDLFYETVNEMPGELFRLPNSVEHYNKQKRNEKIKEDYYAGMEIHELMVKYPLSKATIYKIIEKR